MRRYWPAIVAGAISLATYALTLCPTVYVEGSGELIGAVYFLGTAHPTGYPLFCLFGRLVAAALPLSSPAQEVNAASALSGALAVAALGALLVQRRCRAGVALGAALAFAFSSTFWSQVVVAEVYGLSVLGTVVAIGLGLRAAESLDERHELIAAFAAGLALTTHLSVALFLPGLIFLYIIRRRRAREEAVMNKGSGAGEEGIRRQRVSAWGTVVRAALAGLAGFSLVLYLPLRNGRGRGFHWGDLDSVTLVWDHVTGALYRGSFLSLPWDGIALNAQRFGQQIVDEFGILLIPPIIWGLWRVVRRDKAVALTVGSGVTLNLLAALNYHRDPNGLPVFFIPTYLGAAVLLGFGLDGLVRRLQSYIPSTRLPSLVGLLTALCVLGYNVAGADRSRNWIPYRYGLEILQGLPRDAILFTEGDDVSYVLDYLKRLEGVRPDVALYNRMGRGTDVATGFAPRDRSGHGRRQRERDLLLQSAGGGRPVYYVFARQMPDGAFRFEPEGLVFRAVPRIADGVEGRKDGAVIDLDTARQRDIFRDPWVRKIQANYWFMVGEHLAQAGNVKAAVAAYDSAAKVAYDSRTTRFNVAVKLFQNNRLNSSMEHLRAALRLDPGMGQARDLAAAIDARQRQGQQ